MKYRIGEKVRVKKHAFFHGYPTGTILTIKEKFSADPQYGISYYVEEGEQCMWEVDLESCSLKSMMGDRV